MGIRLKRVYDAEDISAWNAALEEETVDIAAKMADALPEVPLDVLRRAAGTVARTRVETPAPIHLDVEAISGDEQNFSERLVRTGVEEGWLTLSRGELIIHTSPDAEDVAFKVLETPGVYCCHCNTKLDAGNEVAQAHVADAHAGEESPDPQNPSGYRVSNHYATGVIKDG